MPTLVVKNLPEQLHQRLKAQAMQHHRSVTKEAICLLEQGLLGTPQRTPVPLPPPIKLKSGPVTTEWILAAIAEGRE